MIGTSSSADEHKSGGANEQIYATTPRRIVPVHGVVVGRWRLGKSATAVCDICVKKSIYSTVTAWWLCSCNRVGRFVLLTVLLLCACITRGVGLCGELMPRALFVDYHTLYACGGRGGGGEGACDGYDTRGTSREIIADSLINQCIFCRTNHLVEEIWDAITALHLW